MALKEKLLVEFSTHTNEYLSGESLAETFQVSRAAVWKAVKSLQQEGYVIDSSSTKGYCFTDQNDFLREDMIRAFSGITDTPMYVFDEVDSTNNYAKVLCAKGTPHGTLVVANHQTAGRGRQGHSFYSPKNTGLYFTLVIKPENDAFISRITPAAAVATVDAIEEITGIHPGIKWVNDLFVGTRKIAGILTEAITDFETRTMDYVIIGIGINCKEMEFPEEIQNTAASLNADRMSRSALAGALQRHLLHRTAHLDEDLMERYRKDSIVLGQKITYSRNNELFTGIAVDINDAGNLIIKKPDDSTEVLQSGEISIRNWQ
ncbi:MAG: biotin--[Solobacterium sp.]|nr:biotin--[acetyl-CoA-carboxylase] ligase [Solobacterium sp.]